MIHRRVNLKQVRAEVSQSVNSTINVPRSGEVTIASKLYTAAKVAAETAEQATMQ